LNNQNNFYVLFVFQDSIFQQIKLTKKFEKMHDSTMCVWLQASKASVLNFFEKSLAEQIKKLKSNS